MTELLNQCLIGQFVVMNKVHEHKGLQLSSILAPVPTDRTKGILIYPSYYGHLVIGPTAEDQTDREVASVDKVHRISFFWKIWTTGVKSKQVVTLFFL